MTSRHLYELIDACRPGHDDINQPEFGELTESLARDADLQRLFARAQEVDLAIRTTFQAVTPPPGFAERLLKAIDGVADESSEDAPIEIGAAEPTVELAKRSSRRAFAVWIGAASLSAVAALLAVWSAMPQPKSAPTDHAIAETVDQWNSQLDKVAKWQSVANLPEDDFPTWQHLRTGRDDRWQWVSKRRIVCYDFVIRPKENGEIVRLFISKPTSADSLPANPPAGYPSPDGWHVGAWQANGRVYYLAVYANHDSKSLYSRVIGARIAPA